MWNRSRTVAILVLAVSGLTAACQAGTSTGSATTIDSGGSSPASSLAAAPTPTPTATLTPSPTPEPTPEPTPTPKPTPEPWKVHKSKVFKYAIKYPPDWVVTPGSKQRADAFDDFATKFVFVERDTVSTWVDIEGTVDRERAYFKSHYAAKVVSDKRISVGKLSGRLLVFNGTDDGQKLRIQHLIIARGKVGYFLTMWSDRGTEKADAKLFARMYNSFSPS